MGSIGKAIGEKCVPLPSPGARRQISLGSLWPPSILSLGVLAGHRGVSGEDWSSGKDIRRGQWVCENPWADKDAAMLGTAESCSSGALPQGAGAGATLGVVTELWPWAEQAWVVWYGGLDVEEPGT